MKSPWYHRTSIYQIYPRSFYDANGDGIGDLQGILQKLDYIHDLGFETIWVSPFFASPQADTGYDISSHTEIAAEYGTMADVLELIDAVHKRGMKIVFDLVLNHTSVQHPWFQEFSSSRTNPKADWYLWRDAPNNWQSMTGGSGWHYAGQRGQYFWSSFLPFQPDLNYRHPAVKQAMLEVVRFWLGKNVDGFRLDIFNVIYKDSAFRDNPFSFKLLPTEDDPSGFFQTAKYTLNQTESFDFARELRAVTDEYGEKMLLGEVSGSREIVRRFLGDERNNGLGLIFDFGMLNFQFTADFFRRLIMAMEREYPSPFMPVYVFSNHDRRRSIHRLGNDTARAKLLALFQLTIRGVPCVYYGEEIGMSDLPQSFGGACDPIAHKFRWVPRLIFDLLGMTINRDEVRTPMQWNGGNNAGFSTAKTTWLPVHGNYKDVNAAREDVQAGSLLNFVRAAMKIRRQEKALREGSLTLLGGLPDGMIGYVRQFGEEKNIVLLNFSHRKQDFVMQCSECIFKLSTKDKIENDHLYLDGYSGMILK